LLFPAVNLLNWSYQSAKAYTVLVGENPEVFSKTPAETNRSSSRPRPSSGGKYLDADGNSVLLPPPPSSAHSKLAPVHLRWYRSVNQHALPPPNVVDTHGKNSDAPVAAHDVDDDVDDVDVALHADNLTSVSLVHDSMFGSTADVAVTEEGGNLTIEGDMSAADSHRHANVSILLNVSVPKTNATSSNANIAEVLLEDEGSGFIPTRRHVANMHVPAPDSIQSDYPPVYSYGQDEVEIIRLNHESVTLKAGGNSLPQHTSPDANRLNNEVKDIPSFEGDSVDNQDAEDRTDRVERERVTTGRSIISASYQFALQSDATTMQYKDDPKPEVSFFHSSLENASKLNRLETENNTSATEYSPQSIVEHVVPEHGSKLILHSASESVPNSHAEVSHNIMNVNTSDSSLTALPKVDLLEVTPDTNSTSRHAKRVLVNVTIATEDDDPSNKTGYHSSNHQPVYVLSVSVPTSGESEQVAGINISPSSQKVASVLLGLSNENGTQTLVSKHEQLPPPPTTTTITPLPTTTAFHLWGGVCECSCPCLDNSDSESDPHLEGDGIESVSTDTSVITENVTVPTTQQGNNTEEQKQNDDKALIPENVTVTEESNIGSEILITEPDQVSTVSLDMSVTTIPAETTETTTTTTSNLVYSSPPEHISESSNAEVLINSSLSPIMENVSSTSVSDVVTEVSTEFTSTESSRQDCPVSPTVTPPPPLILVIEGKIILKLYSVSPSLLSP
jgi:hypothetical protein